MKVTGMFKEAVVGVDGKMQITFFVDDKTEAMTSIPEIKDEILEIDVTKYRKHRSLDANALLWACIGQVAEALKKDKWEVYLTLLNRYGKYTYVLVPEQAVEQLKLMWRECEVVGEDVVNGKKMAQVLCYFGSSTYNTQEFSALLEGTISDMKEMGLHIPASKTTEASLREWSRTHGL